MIEFVKSQIVTSRNTNFYSGQDDGRRKPPYAFTEQGICILATVLKGENYAYYEPSLRITVLKLDETQSNIRKQISNIPKTTLAAGIFVCPRKEAVDFVWRHVTQSSPSEAAVQ